MRHRNSRKTVELPPAQRVIPTGMPERRQTERSAFVNYKRFVDHILSMEMSDERKVNALKLLNSKIEKERVAQWEVKDA